MLDRPSIVPVIGELETTTVYRKQRKNGGHLAETLGEASPPR